MGINKVIVISAETKEAQKALDQVNDLLEIQDDEITRLTKDLMEYERQLLNTSKLDIKRREQLNEKIRRTRKELSLEKQSVGLLNKEKQKQNKVIKDNTKNQREYTGVLSIVDKQTGGLISSFQGFSTSIGGATKGMKAFRVALMATGIGALVIAVTSLTAAFTQSEEGQEKLQRGLAAMGAVVKNVMDAFADLGESIINAVTNPKKAVEDLGKGLLKFLKNPIDTITGAFNSAKESAIEFIEETKKEVQAIDEVTKARQKAHHIERDLIVERAQANREINDIRLEAEKRDQYTTTERIALLKKAQKIEEEITQKEIDAKKLLIKAQEEEMAQGKNTIEDKDKLAKLQAELINLDTKKLRSQRLLQTQITTATNQEKAEKEKAIKDEQKRKEEEAQETADAILKAFDDETKRLQGIKDIQDAFEQMVKEENAVKEEEKAIIEKEKALAELTELNATEEQKAKIIAYWDGKILEGKKKDKEAENKLDKEVSKAKLNIAKQTMGLIGQIAGEGSAVGKAMAVGQATISGIEGVQNAFTTAQKNPITAVFPPYPFIQAGLAGAFSALQIKKILSTKADGKGATPSPTVSGGGGGPALTPSVPPQINTVGASGTNQLAAAIGEQEQKPVQAFVVSNDVTTAQGLERNIVEGATI